MAEVWLRTNRRALLVGSILPATVLAALVAALVWSLVSGQHWGLSAALGAAAFVTLWLMAGLIHTTALPRLAYDNGDLLVYLDLHRPTRVPIDIVEVFFLGQGPSELPKLEGQEPETQNVIVRLAESAAEWKHRAVRPALGQWCEGYITIRGAWCEPITPEIVRHMNHRLMEIQRERKAEKAQAAS
jgi:hypothetical protein